MGIWHANHLQLLRWWLFTGWPNLCLLWGRGICPLEGSKFPPFFMWCLFSFWRSWFLEDRHLRADSTAGVAGRWVRSSKAPSHLALQADTVCRTCCQQWPLWVACVILKLKNEKQPGQQQYQDISRLCPIQKASLDISLVSLRKLWW